MARASRAGNFLTRAARASGASRSARRNYLDATTVLLVGFAAAVILFIFVATVIDAIVTQWKRFTESPLGRRVWTFKVRMVVVFLLILALYITAGGLALWAVIKLHTASSSKLLEGAAFYAALAASAALSEWMARWNGARAWSAIIFLLAFSVLFVLLLALLY